MLCAIVCSEAHAPGRNFCTFHRKLGSQLQLLFLRNAFAASFLRAIKKAPIASGLFGPTLPMPFDIDRIFFRGHPMMEGLPFS
jgi:hypothetical protein